MTFGSLFAGIGGMDLGLERAGMTCKWQVEIDPYATRVLAKHWPDVRRWHDVRTFPPSEGDWQVNLIAGGFPCQDVSNAGKRVGIEGNHSGLWSEMARIVRLVRPRHVLVENVAALLGRGIGRVVGDLAECGYDSEWDCLPAASFGAFHIRNRVFLLGYPASERRTTNEFIVGSDDKSLEEEFDPRSRAMLDSELCRSRIAPEVLDNAIGRRHGTSTKTIFAGRQGTELPSWWEPEPNVGRVAHGVPARVDRLRGLGNAVVPQVAEWIGRRILEASNL